MECGATAQTSGSNPEKTVTPPPLGGGGRKDTGKVAEYVAIAGAILSLPSTLDAIFRLPKSLAFLGG